MDNYITKRNIQRHRRTLRVRQGVRGSQQKPRFCVVKTNRHLIAQLIDDEKGITLVGVETNGKELKAANCGKKSKQAAKEVGKRVGQLAKQKQIQQVVFDRGRFKFHGLIAEVANSAREAGLKF